MQNFILSRSSFFVFAPAVLILAGPVFGSGEQATSTPVEAYELKDFVIKDQQMANQRPVSTYESPVSNLDFEPRVDLQARNMAEAQGDVTVRGGIFENTGFRIGSATLIDPQTGHYFAELPIAPEMLSGPKVLTGADNALYGFSSTVATLSYGLTRISEGGSATAGFGDHDLNFQRIHQGLTGPLGEPGDWTWGAEAEASRSESEGTQAFSDHDFFRSGARFQLVGPHSQTDLFAGYQSKFFGQFGMYTGDSFLGSDPFETENLKTRLFLLNHHQSYGSDNHFELTAYTRRHTDHYIFNRFSPDRRLIHETDVHALALSGQHSFDGPLALNYAAQITADTIDSTNLEETFTSRTSTKLTLLPQYRIALNNSEQLTLRAGASFDDTNRDSDHVSAILDATWTRHHANGHTEKAYLAYTESSQVAGYTAIGGPTTSGLFRSNPDLERETSQNLEFGIGLERRDWTLDLALFYRWDNDLVDWTFDSLTTSAARAANPVDIEVHGFEGIATRRWRDLQTVIGYTYLHKEEDYGSTSVLGSFYALNYPEHRATLGLIWQATANLELRLDNEYRAQEANPLRSGPDEAFYSHLGISFYPAEFQGLEIFAAFDKPWDESFQEVPGTPGRGDQFSAGATYSW
ncbi:MAG: TonB-dependent receptor plug domain-containing protein [Opitutales bacterium]